VPEVTIVVPTYNEGGNVQELVRQLGATFQAGQAEIVFVDDSTDETPDVIREAGRTSTLPVRLLHRTGSLRTGGLAGAVADGIRASEGEIIVVMDGDLQHPPAVAAQLVETVSATDSDLVLASRYTGSGAARGLASPLRHFVSGGSTTLARCLFPRRVGRLCSDPMTGFFCFRRSAVDTRRLKPRGFKILLEILASHDLCVGELPFVFGERVAGESKASWANGIIFLRQVLALRVNRSLRWLLALVTVAAATALATWRLHLASRPYVEVCMAGLAVILATGAGIKRFFPGRRASGVHLSSEVLPPSDREKYAYLAARQHRWLFGAQAVAAVGVAVSMFGLARNSYWTMVLFIPMVPFVLEQALALRTSTFTRRVTLTDHLFTVETYSPVTYPSIDVFLPTAGEPLGLLLNTYRHVACLDWPGELNIYVLDDATRAEVQRIAESMGFHYLARQGNTFKKAGNLQFGLERSNGEHISIFDADFAPRPDFLRELVPYMEVENVGIVQSPQYFDTTKRMGWLERCAGATQEMFYRFIQPSRDSVGAAICVGTSAIYRRRALEAIGGFPRIAHSEDVYTGLAMQRAGFSLQYVPVLLSKGKSPADLASFVSQQYRWCEGSMSLASDRTFHADELLTSRQRRCFLSGFLYYLTTAMNSVLAPVGVLIMVWCYPERVATSNMIPLLGAIVFWLVVFPLMTHGRWRFEVLRVQAIYGFAHLFCLLDLARGRSAEWIPTNANAPAAQNAVRTKGQRVALAMALYLGATQAATAVGLGLGAFRFGLADYWGCIAASLVGSYVFVPVVVQSARALWASRGEGSPALTNEVLSIGRVIDITSDANPPALWAESV
jgi:cellulose synthase (UDP-forming)